MDYRYSKFFRIEMSLPVHGSATNMTDFSITPVTDTMNIMNSGGILCINDNAEIEVYNEAIVIGTDPLIPHPVIPDQTDLYFMIKLYDQSFSDYSGTPVNGQFDYTQMNITPAIPGWQNSTSSIIFFNEDLTATGSVNANGETQYPLGTSASVVQTVLLPIVYPQTRIQYTNTAIADLQVVNILDIRGNVVISNTYAVMFDPSNSRMLSYSLNLSSLSTGYYTMQLAGIPNTNQSFILDSNFELNGCFGLAHLQKDSTRMVYNTSTVSPTAPFANDQFTVWSFAPG